MLKKECLSINNYQNPKITINGGSFEGYDLLPQ
jgi:hypothetical protein